MLVDLTKERAKRGLSTDPWVSKTMVAKHYSVSTRTVERWLNNPSYRRGGRQVPSRRLWGGPVRFQLAAVDAWLEEDAS